MDDDDDDGAGGSTTTSTTTAAPATVEAACLGIADRDLACYEDDSFDVPRCVATEPCFRHLYRDDAEQPALDCFAAWSTAPACGGPWCTETLNIGALPEHQAHAARCATHEQSCGGSDICGNSVAHLEPALVASLDSCFDGSCAAFDDCISSAYDAYLSACGGDAYPW